MPKPKVDYEQWNKRICPWSKDGNHIFLVHHNGVKECLACKTLRLPDTPRMRELYDLPQYQGKLEWIR